MSPASGKAPLRGIGPEDVDAGGELAPKVQDQNQAHLLIKHVAASHPIELTTIQQLEEDAGRTKALDEEEVREAAVNLVGDEEKKGGLVEVLSARVRGYGKPVDQLWVVVLYETPSGRNARCAVPYEPMSASIAAYDEGVAKGTIVEGKPTDAEQTHLEAQTRRQDATIKRLEAEVEQLRKGDDDTGGSGDGDTPPAGETPEELQARIAELEAEKTEAEARAEKAEEEAKDARAGVGTEDAAAAEPEQVDLDAVELPAGKADELVKAMPFFDENVVAALAQRDERKSVREAAEAVQKQRTEDAAAAESEG